jgi:diaminohydroxyphosphoribosylaminopyrimidine deaminase / 5-amino-6-(5-phosphoribosylamino)uracil reductase
MPAALSATDRAHLARAIAIAETGRARTRANPAVGCVLADRATIVGEGATATGGAPHAEAVALARAGGRARGATAYVTLSPCTHHGRTPPCADALVTAGIARVVVALDDPNPVARGGVAHLAAAGVDVVVLDPDDAYAGTVARQLEGFLRVVADGRPHLTLKLAQSADGSLEPADGRRWVTSEHARRAVHRLRRAVDAVLVGSGTVLADDPGLDVRLVSATRSPRPVVLDARLRTPVDARVVRPGALVVTGTDAPSERVAALERRGATIVRVATAEGGGVDLPAAMRALAAHDVTSVLAEPGPTLSQALLDARLIDRLVLHVAEAQSTAPARRAVALGGGWSLERAGGTGPDAIVQMVPSGAARGHRAAA